MVCWQIGKYRTETQFRRKGGEKDEADTTRLTMERSANYSVHKNTIQSFKNTIKLFKKHNFDEEICSKHFFCC